MGSVLLIWLVHNTLHLTLAPDMRFLRTQRQFWISVLKNRREVERLRVLVREILECCASPRRCRCSRRKHPSTKLILDLNIGCFMLFHRLIDEPTSRRSTAWWPQFGHSKLRTSRRMRSQPWNSRNPRVMWGSA